MGFEWVFYVLKELLGFVCFVGGALSGFGFIVVAGSLIVVCKLLFALLIVVCDGFTILFRVRDVCLTLHVLAFRFVWHYHESELWKSKAGVLVYKDRGGLKIDLATGQN